MAYDFATPCSTPGVHPFVRAYGVSDPKILPHSVAEMRFRLAPEITCAMHDIVSENCFGYQPPESSYQQAVVGWMQRRHSWAIQPDWLTQTTGVVTALGLCIRAFTQPGDGVIIQTPVYPPFRRSVEGNERIVVENPLINENGCYRMDFEDLQEKAKSARLLILCSPHNPVGRVWRPEELQRLAQICLENDLLIVSDEIHFDLAFQPHSILPQICPEIAERCVVCTAPSKTFNLAGCSLSNIIIPNPALRERFQLVATRDCGHFVNVFGYAACEAAYNHCEGWLEQLLQQLQENSRVFTQTMLEIFPEAIISPLEGTYLQWVDLRCLGLEQEALLDLFRRAQVIVNDGEEYGQAGAGFIRFNLACPLQVLQDSLARLKCEVQG